MSSLHTNNNSRDDGDDDDTIASSVDQDQEILRSLRVARARQHAIQLNIKQSLQDQHNYNSTNNMMIREKELKETIQSQVQTIKELKEQIGAHELTIRESQYEFNQLKAKQSELISLQQQRPKKSEIRCKADIVRLKQALERIESQVYNSHQQFGHQCDKIIKLVHGVTRHFDQQSKSTRGQFPVVNGLLSKVNIALCDLKEQLLHSSSSGYSVYGCEHDVIDDVEDSDDVDHPAAHQGHRGIRLTPNDIQDDLRTLRGAKRLSASRSNSRDRDKDDESSEEEILRSSHESTRKQPTSRVPSNGSNAKSEMLDNALLDMCGTLEEENARLHDHIDTLRKEIDQANRESNVSKLIPHYRLGIVRAKNLIVKLQEQLTSEQSTNQMLRQQLEDTYAELQKALTANDRVTSKPKHLPPNQLHQLRPGTNALSAGAASQRRHGTTLDSELLGAYAPHSTSSSQSRGLHQPSADRMSDGTRYGRAHGRAHGRPVASNIEVGIDDEDDNDYDDEQATADPELQDIDAEIDLLKDQLHKAALAQTHQIMSQVMETVKGSSSAMPGKTRR